MCATCRGIATAAANGRAAIVSNQLTNHGRSTHGGDAGGKAKRQGTDEAIARRQQEAWDRIYGETLNRLLRNCPNA